jgi:3'(2'),5'-bisphosphate nucleotidase
MTRRLVAALTAGEWARDLEVACNLAQDAAAVLTRYYAAGGIAAREKADRSPVTDADLEANAVIVSGLREAFPEDAILSEEEPDNTSRLAARRVWLVDPLDGTRDFVSRSGDFAVHVALALAGTPVVAAVAHPPADRLYAAVSGGGAARLDAEGVRRLAVARGRPLQALRAGITRTARNAALDCFLKRTGLGAGAVPCGASVKALRLAEGDLDLTLTLHGRECEWDTCAPGLIVTEAGGRVTDADGRTFRYNQADVRHRRGVIMSAGDHHDQLVAFAQECYPA